MRLNLSLSLIATCAILLVSCTDSDSKRDYEGIPKDPGIIKMAEQNANRPKADKTIVTQEFRGVHSIRVRNIGYLAKIFNDLNDVHLSVATKSGVSPIVDLKTAYNIHVPIVKVQSCDEFYIDSLSHSMPYLRPKALALLTTIGRNFSDSVLVRSGHKYTVKVTSILRTMESVAALRRHNRNASENSAHQYGLTFDVSYSKFISDDPNFIISLEDLKNTLGEILFDLREQGKCYVKYERHQGCFHITAI